MFYIELFLVLLAVFNVAVAVYVHTKKNRTQDSILHVLIAIVCVGISIWLAML